MTELDDIARDGLGIERLRSGQREAVDAATGGRDVLAVMPTGYGKSAVYQVAAAAVDGCTVVVSPLVALQHDQVEGLADLDVGAAAIVNAGVADTTRAECFEQLAAGELEFVFLAPEQLARDDTMAALRSAGPSLFVVDEAHCISAWGHDFRPDYQRLGEVVQELGHPTVIALTATAAPPVRAEIVERLGLRDPLVLVRGFDRPNIHLAVERHPDAGAKDAALVDRAAVLGAGGSSGIVYVGTRRRAEELAEAIGEVGVPAAAYHAGLSKRVRDDVHRRFLDGDATVVVATTAFGMGIDKPDVRFVLHGDVAESLDAYYQEVGRAGRDGGAADAVLFYRPEDLALRRFLGAGGSVKAADIRALVDGGDGLGPRKRTQVRNRLADLGFDPDDSGLDVAAATSAVERGEAARRDLAASRLEMVRGYAETGGCRRRFLLTYFGEPHDGPCGHCDTCDAGTAEAFVEATSVEHPFELGQRVRHGEWGEGQVLRFERDTVVVLFDDGGYRNLSIAAVVARDLLQRLG